MSKFEGKYTVADGYANQGGRPHYFRINADDLEEDMDEKDLLRFYEESAQDHFEQHISCETDREAEFLEWAREELAKREKDES